MSGRHRASQLRTSGPAILPSLLLCDFGNLKREVAALEEAGVAGLHLDVMDGNFVPNLTYGLPIVEALRRLTDLPLDAHLMIQKPQRYIRQFRDAGADLITFHIEATPEPAELVEAIHELNIAAGVALNPDTPLSSIDDCLKLCDLVLVMSVEAGFGRQQFNPVALEKLRTLQGRVDENVILQVDGGINTSTIESCAQAGAQLFVVGSAIFGADDYGEVIADLKQKAIHAQD